MPTLLYIPPHPGLYSLPMRVTVRFFGKLQEVAGCREELLVLEGAETTAEGLRRRILQEHPLLQGETFHLALRGRTLQGPIQEGEKVSLHPLYSGG